MLPLSPDDCGKRGDRGSDREWLDVGPSVLQKRNKYLSLVINVISCIQPSCTESVCEFEPHVLSGLKIVVPDSQ